MKGSFLTSWNMTFLLIKTLNDKKEIDLRKFSVSVIIINLCMKYEIEFICFPNQLNATHQ